MSNGHKRKETGNHKISFLIFLFFEFSLCARARLDRARSETLKTGLKIVQAFGTPETIDVFVDVVRRSIQPYLPEGLDLDLQYA